MRKHRSQTFVWLSTLLQLGWLGCATGRGGEADANTDDSRETSTSRSVQKSVVTTVPAGRLPTWVALPPTDNKFYYFMGDASGSVEKDDVMERAWYSALIRVGLSEFPELTKLRSRSTETLQNATYERTAVVNLQYIRWAGVTEAKDLGSPFIYQDPRTKGFAVYRLLRWEKKSMKSAQDIARQKADRENVKMEKFEIPDRPEVARQQEIADVESVKRIKAVARRIAARDAELKGVMDNIRCGMTLGDIDNALGDADAHYKDAYSNIVKKFYWGTYEVTTDGGGLGRIETVATNMGSGARRDVCR